MPDYKAPLRDIRFVRDELLGYEAHYQSLPGCQDATPDMVDAILEEGAKFCDKCGGTGKRPYTLHEKITIADLKVSKSGYSERYEPYELIAEGCIENWENSIRNSLARSFHFEPNQVVLA